MNNRTIVFITPNWRWDNAPLPIDTLLPPVAPPLEWAYVSASLSQFSIFLIDAYAENLAIEDVKERIVNIGPVIIVISTAASLLYWRCPPMTLGAAVCLVQAVRSCSKAKIVLIGPHPTHSPDWCYAKTEADFIFCGTPEIELAEFLLNIDELKSPYIYPNSPTPMKNVVKATNVPKANFDIFNWDLDYVPHMWDVTSEEKSKVDLGHKSALIEASRGCPWQCIYCAKYPIRNKYSVRNIEHVEKEIDSLINIGIGYVFFIDEVFNVEGSHLNKLLKVLGNKEIVFGFQGRADLLTNSIAVSLAKAGCVYAELGIDTFSSELSEKIGRKQQVSAVKQGINIAKDHIPIVRYNRLNLSTQDYKEELGLKVNDEWIYPPDPAYPYPGAELGDLVMKKYGKSHFDWEFAKKYSWWLRIEVYLQRNFSDISVSRVNRLKNKFIALDERKIESVIRKYGHSLVDGDFLLCNKYINGENSGLRVRNTSL